MTTYANVGHILLKRGNTIQSDSYTGPYGEITLDFESPNLRIHDAQTPGGIILQSTSPVGATGADGADGADGAAGAPGAAGTDGATGATGPAGETGATGATGETGATGADSTVPGATGETGATGVGATGATGPVSSSVIIKGSRNTPFDLPGYPDQYTVVIPNGQIGDAYIITTGAETGHIFAWDGFNWIDAGLTGVGTPGATGPQGDPGATGPQGDPGDVGATGDPGGATGPQGEPGLDGATGATGPQGDPGDPGGATGPQGEPGQDGATGSTGATGPQGEPGDLGATGASGPAGSTGSQGATGTGLVWWGPWDSEGSYIGGQDIVSYGGSSYIKIGDGNSGSSPDGDPARWELIASKGDQGATGLTGATGAVADYTGTIVTANVALYQNVIEVSDNRTHFVGFYNLTTGNSQSLTDTQFSYNPNTNTLGVQNIVTNGGGAGTGSVKSDNYQFGNSVSIFSTTINVSQLKSIVASSATWEEFQANIAAL